MVKVRFTQDYGNYKKGSEYTIASAAGMKYLIAAGKVEIVKEQPETAVMPVAETATTPAKKKKAKK